MFVRKKKNKSGVISVQVIDKSYGRYVVIKSIGSSANERQVEALLAAGRRWIDEQLGQNQIDFENKDDLAKLVFNSIQSIQLAGIDLLLGKIFEQIGFDKIKDEIFKHLVFYRLLYPVSKLKTTEYLYRYQQIDWDEDKVYRYLDRLHSTQKELVQQISYAHTLKILGGEPHIVFYDVTTLYFEIEQEDEFRQTGFSKEGKHQNPQIVLGLLVSKGGYPLAYDVFDGKKFEGHTLLPLIDAFKAKYQLDTLVVVADAGLLSSNNIEQLRLKKYEFIIGARIKNETHAIQKQILAHTYKNGNTKIFPKQAGLRLVVSYSHKRATKDAANRERGLRRLEKLIRQGKLTKSSINNKGYNKYLKLSGRITVSIDYEKYKKDTVWDGLKGFYTNSSLPVDDIIDNYNQLWQIERAFRVSKTELKIRPICHRLPRRIEAHICLTFVAYKVYKEPERQLKERNAAISATKAIEIASFIFSITARLPQSKQTITTLLIKTDEQKYLASIFNWK